MKFKNGDQVKIIGGKGYDHWDSSGEHLGKIATVTDDISHGEFVFLNDNEWGINFKEEWLEVAFSKKELKIGDKVMTKTRCDKNGEIVTIKKIALGEFFDTTCGNIIGGRGSHCIRLFEIEPIESEEKRFKPGDRVRLIKNIGLSKFNSYIGKVSIITSACGDECQGRDWHLFVDGRLGHIYEKEMELYQESFEGLPCPSDYGWYQMDGNDRYLANWDETTQEKLKQKEVKDKTMAIAIGGKYVPIGRDVCGTYDTCKGSAYVIFKTFEGGSEYTIYDKDGNRLKNCLVCLREDNVVAYNPARHKKGLMKQLSIMATKLVDADVKAFVGAGLLDSELNITEEGRDFVLTQVLNTNKKEYAVEARKIVAENEKKESK